MKEIKCPNCGEVFTVDESGYQQIAQQVRDAEFDKELKRREQELASKQQNDVELMRMQQEQKNQAALSQKDSEIAAKDRELAELRMKLSNSEAEKKLAVSSAVQAKDKELMQKETEITNLQGALKTKDTENQLQMKSMREQFDATLKMKDEQIEQYKDFKAKQSTKMIGESLEQHCMIEFNRIRMGAFPNAYFEKDNDARTGSKGDFIFRESTPDGIELTSIMFEMKNEADTTSTKHKNEDFLKELDKDRREKGCEYAVLVSMLEADNELYNTGIVDVSYKYPKMYIIRPQFFIPLITLIRNASLNALKYKQELAIVKNQQLDFSNFEENMNAFKEGFSRNYRLASERFATAIEEIDKTIQHLQKTLPHNVKIQCCMTCKHGTLCPYGNLPNYILCSHAVMINSKDDVIDWLAEMTDVKEIEKSACGYCEKFEFSNENDYTYNDYFYYLKH